jgi:hypothetical protein
MKPVTNHRKPLIEPLENRLLCKLAANGEFAITPPSGADAHSAVILRPQQGVIGPRTAEANSNGVVNWEITQVHEWTPGDQSGPHQFAT